MWTIIAIVIGAVLASSAAIGLVHQQTANRPGVINAPLVVYGTR
jgi:hypothetical protein